MRYSLLLTAAVVSTGLSAQSVSLNFGDLLAKSKNIILVAGDKSFFELKAVDFQKSWGSTFGKSFFVKIDSNIPKFSPESIQFADNNPTRGMNICFLHLVKDGDNLKGELKKGFSGNSTHPDYFPYPGKKGPEPIKDANGKYSISLPEPLAPGYYALASDSKAWVFEVSPKLP